VGKVVVDCVVPMGWDEPGAYVAARARGVGSAAGGGAAAGFAGGGGVPPPVGAAAGGPVAPTIDGHVVVGHDRASTDLVQALTGRLPGMRGTYAGQLRNAAQVEALTVDLVSVDRRHKAHAGIRITDV
jgi:8-hydroxy-5-deazaflavin:NADPH oxidoreductase